MRVEGTEGMTEIVKDNESNKNSDESEEVFDPNKTIKNESENSQIEPGSNDNDKINNEGSNSEISENDLLVTTEATNENGKRNASKKNPDESEEVYYSNKKIKNEDENSQTEPGSDDNIVNNADSNSVIPESDLLVTTKVEELPKEPVVNHTSSEVSSALVEPKCEDVENKNAVQDTKNPFKICRLCLVFVDDNFVPLEKVMVMLQIVLPEVVSKHILIIIK